MKNGQQKLHPKAVWIFFGYNALWRFSFIGLLWAFGFLYFRLTSLALVFLLLSLAGFGVTYLWARWSYEAFRYQLTEYGFYKESGVMQKKPVVIPYNKMHKVEIYRGILQNILRLAGLRIQIAGRYRIRRRRGLFGQEGVHTSRLNTLAEEELPGLSVEVAEHLKTELLVRRATSKESETQLY